MGDPAAQGCSPPRCPACAAALRPGAPWCTLCYADLRPTEPGHEPGPEPVAAAEPAGPAAGPRVTAVQLLLDGSPEPGWPCPACQQHTPLGAGTCAGCGEPFLAALRREEPALLRLPVVGDVLSLDRRARLCLAGAAAGGGLVLTSLLGLLD